MTIVFRKACKCHDTQPNMGVMTRTARIFARIAAALGNDQADAAAYAAPTYEPWPVDEHGNTDLHEVARVTEAQLQANLEMLAFGRRS